jgi:hypothetical protein
MLTPTKGRRWAVKMAKIPVIVLLGIVVASLFACGVSLEGEVELPSEFQGVVEVEHESDEVITGTAGKILGVDIWIWNVGTQTIDYSYELNIYDSEGLLLDKHQSSSHLSLEPGGHNYDHIWCWQAPYEKVASYKIIVIKK